MTCDRPLRVVLIGAESTGKTTLAIELAKHYDTIWVAEYGRENWQEKLAAQSLKGGDIPDWTDENFIHIAQEQQRRENAAAARANRVLICDTNAFATGTWYERYAGKRHLQVDAIGNQDIVDLYLIPTPEVPFVQDGVRDGEAIRGWMHDRFVSLIEEAGIPYTLITGTWEGRVDQAIAAINALLAPCLADAPAAP